MCDLYTGQAEQTARVMAMDVRRAPLTVEELREETKVRRDVLLAADLRGKTLCELQCTQAAIRIVLSEMRLWKVSDEETHRLRALRSWYRRAEMLGPSNGITARSPNSIRCANLYGWYGGYGGY